VDVERDVTRIAAVEVVQEIVVEGIVPREAVGDVAPKNDQSALYRQGVPGQPRLIIKDGRLVIESADPVQTANRAIDEMVRLGGYIIEHQQRQQGGFPVVTLRFGIPVVNFESGMATLRGLGTLLNESASGVDVTEEVVDLDSRLENLQATQVRVRSFLDNAKTIEEALKVNQELKKIEEEINVLLGRRTFLVDRAAFSTIALELNPIRPTPTATPSPTPTPTPTPTPLPTPDIWRPGDTTRASLTTLQNTSQGVGDVLIRFVITTLPWLLLPGGMAWGTRRVIGRFFRKPEHFPRRPLPPRSEESAD
jgi:hypothetical protein